MRVSTQPDDPGFTPDTMKLVVFLDGVDQRTVEGRFIFMADEEEGLIRFNKAHEGGPNYGLVWNAAHDGFEEFEIRGRVEIKHMDGEMPMHLRGFGV